VLLLRQAANPKMCTVQQVYNRVLSWLCLAGGSSVPGSSDC